MDSERFHVGHNFVGSLPTKEIECFEEWRRAASYLVTMMRNYADEDDDAAFDSAHPDTTGYSSFDDWVASDDAPHMLATVQAILKDDPPVEPQDYGATVEDNNARQVYFWLAEAVCNWPQHTLRR